MTLFIWGRKNRNLKHAVQHVFYSELPLCQQYRGRQRWFLLKISLQTFALYYVHNVTDLEQFMPQSRLRPQSIICLKCFTIRNSFCLWGSLSLSQPHPLITARSKKKNKKQISFSGKVKGFCSSFLNIHITLIISVYFYFCIINTSSSHTNGYHANMENSDRSQIKCNAKMPTF